VWPAERAGTFTNTERRLQRFEPAVPPPGQARADWWIIAEIGDRISRLLASRPRPAPWAGWTYGDPAAIMAEVAAVTPSYGGISHERLGQAGLQWPCPTPAHSGTPILHVDRFARGRARFTPVTYRPAAEVPDADYPLVLTTGRVLEHYHSGTMTRRVHALDWLVPEALVEVHPGDAARFGVADGLRVRLRSRCGAVTARVRLTPDIRAGAVFMSFHFAEAAANELTRAALDSVAKVPEYKVCAVALDVLQP
jgi:predicted molibdopterin-dependent oxidoreductase YjgC